MIEDYFGENNAQILFYAHTKSNNDARENNNNPYTNTSPYRVHTHARTQQTKLNYVL